MNRSFNSLKTFQKLYRSFSTGVPLKTHHQNDAKGYTHIKLDRVGSKKNVGLVTMNKPKVNSLSEKMILDLGAAFDELEADQSIAAIVVTGGPKIFSGGADIEEMSKYEFHKAIAPNGAQDFAGRFEKLVKRRLPIIAAVNGVALGGGCEIAMQFDIIYAGKGARFGQPEIKIGVIPGFGGTQLLPRQVGKSRAMELILTGDMASAEEMERAGLVSKVLPDEQVLPEAIKCAERIGQHSKLAVMYAKRAVKAADELPLSRGIDYERQLFYTLFASHDKQEGMRAFLEKRSPKYKDC